MHILTLGQVHSNNFRAGHSYEHSLCLTLQQDRTCDWYLLRKYAVALQGFEASLSLWSLSFWSLSLWVVEFVVLIFEFVVSSFEFVVSSFEFVVTDTTNPNPSLKCHLKSELELPQIWVSQPPLPLPIAISPPKPQSFSLKFYIWINTTPVQCLVKAKF